MTAETFAITVDREAYTLHIKSNLTGNEITIALCMIESISRQETLMQICLASGREIKFSGSIHDEVVTWWKRYLSGDISNND